MTMLRFSKHSVLLAIFLLVWVGYVFYSYAFIDLNLTLSSNRLYQTVQQQLIYLGYFQRPLSTLVFSTIAIVLFLIYFILLTQKNPLPLNRKVIIWFVVLLGIGWLGYPPFSHDIFNYLFDAKMVLVYHVDPHFHYGLQFPQDQWTRFMHNIHVSGEYGYVWTGLSILPITLTMPHFTLSFFTMRVVVIICFIVAAYFFYRIAAHTMPEQANRRLLLFVLNPLILTETVLSSHNDSMMMAFALAAFFVLERGNGTLRSKLISSVLLIISALAKIPTIILLPLVWIKKYVDIYTLGGMALLALMLVRANQMHSWYFQWGIILLLLSKKSWVVLMAVLLSFGALIRYAPYIYFGSWDPPVPLMRQALLLLPLAFYLIRPLRKLFNQFDHE